MSNINAIHIKYFRHFSERLSLRYDILITFEEYVQLCKIPIDVLLVQTSDTRKKSLLGYLQIKDKKVKVVKEFQIDGSPLTTALPVTFIFKHNKK